jgi:acyl-CoA hydrolase
VEALIRIADPKFRAELEDFARHSKLLEHSDRRVSCE